MTDRSLKNCCLWVEPKSLTFVIRTRMMKDIPTEIAKRISSDLDVQLPDSLSDEEMIMHIADRVEQLLKGDPDLLLSYLYRLDVEEKKIAAALETSIMPVHVTFANLIWERQKQRMETKSKFRQDPIKGWEF